MDEMRERCCVIAKNVPAGKTVWNGFTGGKTTCTAPSEPGTYTLYELAWPGTNEHAGWEWVREPES